MSMRRRERDRRSGGADAVGGDFDFGDAAEGEEEFNQVFRRRVGRLTDDVTNGVGDRGVEQDALNLDAGEVDADHVSGLEGSVEHGVILSPRAVQVRQVRLAGAAMTSVESRVKK